MPVHPFVWRLCDGAAAAPCLSGPRPGANRRRPRRSVCSPPATPRGDAASARASPPDSRMHRRRSARARGDFGPSAATGAQVSSGGEPACESERGGQSPTPRRGVLYPACCSQISANLGRKLPNLPQLLDNYGARRKSPGVFFRKASRATFREAWRAFVPQGWVAVLSAIPGLFQRRRHRIIRTHVLNNDDPKEFSWATRWASEYARGVGLKMPCATCLV